MSLTESKLLSECYLYYKLLCALEQDNLLKKGWIELALTSDCEELRQLAEFYFVDEDMESSLILLTRNLIEVGGNDE